MQSVAVRQRGPPGEVCGCGGAHAPSSTGEGRIRGNIRAA